jgi:hypothetical protein
MDAGDAEFWVKDHGLVLAVCDKELLGKKVDGVVINERFYKGELLGREKLEEKLNASKNVNMFGKKSTDVAVSLKLAEKTSCLMIGGVPHLQLVFL